MEASNWFGFFYGQWNKNMEVFRDDLWLEQDNKMPVNFHSRNYNDKNQNVGAVLLKYLQEKLFEVIFF